MSPATAQTVVDWIAERHGERAASRWLWNCTPYPCGLPSAEQLEEGLRLAAGEVTLDAVIAACERRMEAAMAEIPE